MMRQFEKYSKRERVLKKCFCCHISPPKQIGNKSKKLKCEIRRNTAKSQMADWRVESLWGHLGWVK